MLGLAVAAGLAAVTLAAGPAGQVVAQQGGVTLTITKMSPQYAQADSTIMVSGTVSNGTGSPLAGLSVQLYSSGTPIEARSTMDRFADDSTFALSTVPENAATDSITKTIPAGGSAGWSASFTAADAGMAASGFGVYPVRAVLTSVLTGSQLGEDRTLLPYWPGSHSGVAKLKIAWAWPLIDQPHQTACLALSDNDLQASLQDGGRLARLLQAGGSAAAAQAKLTWLIDPALLTDVKTMTQRTYQTGGDPTCTGSQVHPASQAARAWLDTLKTTIDGQPVVATPYANVDVAALTHNGLSDDLDNAYAQGDTAVRSVLGNGVEMNMSFPAGGHADLSVLIALAATEHVSSAVLSSADMPLASGYGEDAVSSVHTMTGTMHLLLADSKITAILGKAGTTAPFAEEQRFLAETAMIASEVPESSRSVVVSPPQTWAPPAVVAESLLSESSQAPWLRPVTLGSLTSAHDSGGAPRQPPPDGKVSSHELSKAYLTAVQAVRGSLDSYTSMLYPPDPAYTGRLAEAFAACESSAWRGGARGGQAAVGGLARYLGNVRNRVRILISRGYTVQMAGSSGSVPVSVQNDSKQTVRVRLDARPRAGSSLTVAPDKPLVLAPGQSRIVRLSVHSAPQGSSQLRLQLVNANGAPITVVDSQTLTIDSTRYGRAILIVIAGALGLLVLTSVFRSGLRSRRRMLSETNSEKPETEEANEPADA